MIKNRKPHVKAIIKNQRPSKNKMYSGYRPAFRVEENYLTTGEICFINCSELEYGKEALATISFITPQLYLKKLSIGQKITIQEAKIRHGEATIIEIYDL